MLDPFLSERLHEARIVEAEERYYRDLGRLHELAALRRGRAPRPAPDDAVPDGAPAPARPHGGIRRALVAALTALPRRRVVAATGARGTAGGRAS